MKKLQLDSLQVDSFATIDVAGETRGTVAGRENTAAAYPDTWIGTCWETCEPQPRTFGCA
jgi:hypothetical protein